MVCLPGCQQQCCTTNNSNNNNNAQITYNHPQHPTMPMLPLIPPAQQPLCCQGGQCNPCVQNTQCMQGMICGK